MPKKHLSSFFPLFIRNDQQIGYILEHQFNDAWSVSHSFAVERYDLLSRPVRFF